MSIMFKLGGGEVTHQDFTTQTFNRLSIRRKYQDDGLRRSANKGTVRNKEN